MVSRMSWLAVPCTGAGSFPSVARGGIEPPQQLQRFYRPPGTPVPHARLKRSIVFREGRTETRHQDLPGHHAILRGATGVRTRTAFLPEKRVCHLTLQPQYQVMVGLVREAIPALTSGFCCRSPLYGVCPRPRPSDSPPGESLAWTWRGLNPQPFPTRRHALTRAGGQRGRSIL